jgi:metal-responsive CopG/Arc/MetJ family transcriptional regulator
MVLSGYCGSIIGSMKEKTSITLSREVLAGIDRMAGSKQSRSAFIEGVLHRYLIEQAKAARDVREIELINKHADELNAEAEDVLRYQAPPRER